MTVPALRPARPHFSFRPSPISAPAPPDLPAGCCGHVAAWDSGATPLVIITKADLADVADDVVGKVILQAAGADVVTTSAETGEVRSGDFKGKHTTTSRELVPLANGTVLMDTPGVRGFGLFDAEDGIGEMFGDVEASAAGTRGTGPPQRRRGATGLPAGVAPEGGPGREVPALGGAGYGREEGAGGREAAVIVPLPRPSPTS